MLAYKSVWIFGGDGWAYDIGYGGPGPRPGFRPERQRPGVRYRGLFQYRRPGLQGHSHAPPPPQFAAAGKAVKKKDLAAIAMSYGYVYVAQVAMGADYEQCMKAFLEAEAYDGPSLIIAYAPCSQPWHQGWHEQVHDRDGKGRQGWLLAPVPLRSPPDQRALPSGTARSPTRAYRQFVMGEHRYSPWTITFPERAKELLTVAENQAKNRYLALKKRAKDD